MITGSSRWTLFWGGLALLASTLVVILARQNLAASARLQRVIERVSYPRPGVFVPTADVPQLGGGTARIGETTGGRRQLLVVFTTTCPYCRASQAAWRQLDSVRRNDSLLRDLDVYGVVIDSVDSLPAYVANAGLRFPVVEFRGKLRPLYRFTTVPLLVVIDSTGRTEYVKQGVLASSIALDSVLLALRRPREPVEGGASTDPSPGR